MAHIQLNPAPSSGGSAMPSWTTTNPTAWSHVSVPGVVLTTVSTASFDAASIYYFPFYCEAAVTFDQVVVEVTTASGTPTDTTRVLIYNSGKDLQPTTLVEDLGTFISGVLGVKSVAPAGGTRTLPAGRYLFCLSPSVTYSSRILRGSVLSTPVRGAATLGTTPFDATLALLFAGGVGAPWTTSTGGSLPSSYPLFLRITAVA